MNLVSFVWQHKTVFFTGLLVVGVLFYHFLIRAPDVQATVYMTRVSSSAKELEKAFKAVSASTSRQLFNEPDVPIEAKIQQVADINNVVSRAQNQLAVFRQEAAKPLAVGFGAKREQAGELQDKAKLVVAQSQDVLGEYARAGSFMADYYAAQYQLRPYLSFARLTNYLDAAATLRSYSDQLQSLNVPSDFKDVYTATIDMLDAAASTLENVASGRAGQPGILQLAQTSGNLDNQLFTLIGETSSTVQNARDLPDKLQSIGL